MIKDIYPSSSISKLDSDLSSSELENAFDIEIVSPIVGMSPSYIQKALSKKRIKTLTLRDVVYLLDLDTFSETFIPRSRIPSYLLANRKKDAAEKILLQKNHILIKGSATDLIRRLPAASIQCVVTSTPYWGTRIYETSLDIAWADGEVCPFGHEQTPEGFIRHTIEILYLLKPTIRIEGSIWWNLMDTYNTRTQIRSSASETLRAMQGKDKRAWKDHDARRYSARHSFLKDGEQSMIPYRVAERASRIGYWVKSVITWKKNGSMPETVDSRVTRELEYVIHLTAQRTPLFKKSSYRKMPEQLGGRNEKYESDKLTDVWHLPTSPGRDGHGAQFPLALPARCIALTTRENDWVLDPFIGSGTTALAAAKLNRKAIGFDVSQAYLDLARSRLAKLSK